MWSMTMSLSLDFKETSVYESPNKDELPHFLTLPSFPKNLTDTKTPEYANKWKNGIKDKKFGKKGKNEETEGMYNTRRKIRRLKNLSLL